MLVHLDPKGLTVSIRLHQPSPEAGVNLQPSCEPVETLSEQLMVSKSLQTHTVTHLRSHWSPHTQ